MCGNDAHVVVGMDGRTNAFFFFTSTPNTFPGGVQGGTPLEKNLTLGVTGHVLVLTYKTKMSLSLSPLRPGARDVWNLDAREFVLF